MEIKVSLVVPLSGVTDSFTLTGPCTCCGEPGQSAWDHHMTYELKQWIAGEKGPVLAGYKTADGQQAEGKLDLHFAYCNEHYQQTLRLRQLQRTLNWIIGLGSAAVTLLVFFNLSLDKFQAANTTPDKGFWLCASPIIVAAASAFLLMILMQGIQSNLAKKPENAEFPLEGLSGGASGVRIATGADGGTPGRGQVRYFLTLDFLNPETAKRFLAAYPSAAIKAGHALVKS